MAKLTGSRTSAQAATPRGMGRPKADLPGVSAHNVPLMTARPKASYTPRDFTPPRANRNPKAYNGAVLERSKTHMGHPPRGYGA